MKVFAITANFHPERGGIQEYCASLVRHMAASGREVGVATAAGQTPPAGLQCRHYPCPGLGGSTSRPAWDAAVERLEAAIRAFDPALIHFLTAGAATFAPRLAALGLPMVATVHGNDLTSPWQEVPGRDSQAAVLDGIGCCRRVIAVSAHTAVSARRLGVSVPVEVIHGGCDLTRFRPAADIEEVWQARARFGLPLDRSVILTCGRIEPRKGHHVVADALARLHRPFHWAVTGTGRSRLGLRLRLLGRGLSRRVGLLGWVSVDDLPVLYRAADLFVMVPVVRVVGHREDAEGYGLVYAEAAASGLPSIASDCGGCREAVRHGETGLLVAPGDPGALADAIDTVLADRALATRLGAGGRSASLAHGGWPAVVHRILALYDSIIEERAA